MQAGARVYPAPPLPDQHLKKPGREAALELQPMYHAPHYKGSEKLLDMVALITGADSGIGRAVAVLFAREGADVAVAYLDEHDDAEETKRAVEREGRRCILLSGDVADPKYCKAAVDRTVEKFGKLDILFANAGIPGNTPAGKTSEELFRQIIDINLTSVFFTVEDALPYLNDGASIILNGSVIGTLGQPGYAAYAATKAGVRALARSLAGDLSQRGIRVNVVAPGATKTPIWSRNASRTEEQVSGLEKQLNSLIPLGRMGEAEEIAKAVLFLASDDSSYVQGAELFVDGGLTGTPFGGSGARG